LRQSFTGVSIVLSSENPTVAQPRRFIILIILSFAHISTFQRTFFRACIASRILGCTFGVTASIWSTDELEHPTHPAIMADLQGRKVFKVFNQDFIVDERYTVTKELGQGAYGIVWYV
jgi:hypothetical protein